MGTDSDLHNDGDKIAYTGKRGWDSGHLAPGLFLAKYPMHITTQHPGRPGSTGRPLAWSGIITLFILVAVGLGSTGCTKSTNTSAPTGAARDASLRQIAVEYARGGDLAQAEAALSELALANPAQLIVALAESDINDGRPAADVAALAQLAEALGVRSPKLVAYLQPTPEPTVATATAWPSPTPEPSATPAAPTATLLPTETPAPTETAVPQTPRVAADSAINLRSGPGRAYPVIGRMQAGQEIDIIGRNASGDWWQLAWPGKTQAWVAGTVVRVLGPIDTVAVAKVIPTPPPAPTAAPRPTAAPAVPATAQPQAGPNFRVINIRLWTVQENGGFFDGPSVHCGEKRQLRVTVVDAAGNPLNGVTIRSAFTGEEQVTGSKGPGIAEYILGTGQDVYIVRDADGREVTSDYARGMSTQPEGISQDQLIAAGYCQDAASCAYHLTQGCRGHYSWDVTFRRAY